MQILCYEILFLRLLVLFCKMIATCIKKISCDGMNCFWIETIKFNPPKNCTLKKLNSGFIKTVSQSTWRELSRGFLFTWIPCTSYLYFFWVLSLKKIYYTLFTYMVIALFMRNLCIARVERCSFLFSQSNACINNSTITVDTVIF